ncbi:MAG: ferredoxin-thioredoxin reductase catalytic domain-containing protein [Candidatus Bathyarchaeia archaeon]
MTTLEEVRRRAESDAKTHGYYLNPNEEFLKELLEGLKRNEERYGYPSCPCRLASGKFELDRDIICPCDYRNVDVEEFGACYCALYVRKDVFEGKTSISPVPERRPIEKQVKAYGSSTEVVAEKPHEEPVAEAHGAKMKLWYCKQCGYIVYREEPPYICPICKAKREMFAEIRLKIDLIG